MANRMNLSLSSKTLLLAMLIATSLSHGQGAQNPSAPEPAATPPKPLASTSTPTGQASIAKKTELESFTAVTESVLKADERAIHTVETAFTWGGLIISLLVVVVGGLGTYFGVSTYKETRAKFDKRLKDVEKVMTEAASAKAALDQERKRLVEDRVKWERDLQGKADDLSAMLGQMKDLIADATLLAQKSGDIDTAMKPLPGLKPEERARLEPEIMSHLLEAEGLARRLDNKRMLSWILAKRCLLFYHLGKWPESLAQAQEAAACNVGEKADRSFNLACLFGKMLEHFPTHSAYKTDSLNALEETLRFAKKNNDPHQTLGHWIEKVRTDDDLEPIRGADVDRLIGRYVAGGI